MQKLGFFIAVVCIVGFFSLRFVSDQTDTSPNSVEAGGMFAARPVIVRLMDRDQILSITTGSNGRRYNLEARDGSVIFSNLSKYELQDQYPEIYMHIQKAVANGSQYMGTVDMEDELGY